MAVSRPDQRANRLPAGSSRTGTGHKYIRHGLTTLPYSTLKRICKGVVEPLRKVANLPRSYRQQTVRYEIVGAWSDCSAARLYLWQQETTDLFPRLFRSGYSLPIVEIAGGSLGRSLTALVPTGPSFMLPLSSVRLGLTERVIGHPIVVGQVCHLTHLQLTLSG